MTEIKHMNGGRNDPIRPSQNQNTPRQSHEITEAEIEAEERARESDPVNLNEDGGLCRRCELEEGDNLPSHQICPECNIELGYTIPNQDAGKRKRNRKNKSKIRKTLKKKHRMVKKTNKKGGRRGYNKSNKRIKMKKSKKKNTHKKSKKK